MRENAKFYESDILEQMINKKISHKNISKKEKLSLNLTKYKERAEDFLDSNTLSANATKVALVLAILAGVATVAVVAPNIVQISRRFKRSKKYSEKQITGAIQNLSRSGYINTHLVNGKRACDLTPKGKAYFNKILFEDVRLPTQQKWDGKWRFVLFDIPISHEKARDALRWRLKSLGFYQFQKSVWTYPYPCEKEILYVADFYNVGMFLEVLEADHLTNDIDLKKHFDL